MVQEYSTWSINEAATLIISGFVGKLLDASDPFPSAFEGKDFHGVVALGLHHSEETGICCNDAWGEIEEEGCIGDS
jgi:hypothetical protein